MSEVKRPMCIRVLEEDGSVSHTHFECVYAYEYDALEAQLALAEKIRPSPRYACECGRTAILDDQDTKRIAELEAQLAEAREEAARVERLRNANDYPMCKADADRMERAAIALETQTARITALESQLQAMRTALEGLVNKLEFIHADSRYASVWRINQLHAGPYTGPKYVVELAAAKAALIRETQT